MRNIIEIPENTNDAILLINDNENHLTYAAVHGHFSRIKGLGILFQAFVIVLRSIEKEANTNQLLIFNQLRDCFKHKTLEDIADIFHQRFN